MSKAKNAPAQLPVVDSCGTCHWWHSPQQLPVGVCKRYPPTPLPSAGSAQPFTKAEDWCGEFAQAAAESANPAGFVAPIARERAA